MKIFFYITFGGIAAVIGGYLLTSGAVRTYEFVARGGVTSGIDHLASAATAVIKTEDGTAIEGFKRVVRYTADEEEGFFEAATLSLPKASVKNITAKAYMVKNLTTGTVIISHENDKLLPMASLTKLVTAVIAMRDLDNDRRIKLPRAIIETYGNTAQFKTGETFRVDELYYPLLMVSSNDAAEALAAEYGRAKFIKAMNEWVQSIGAYRTYFADPSGLSPDNRSTAADLTLIMDWIRKHRPGIIEITKLKSKTIRSHTWTNPTHFLSWSNYAGGKNGYTDEANRTAAVLFRLGPAKSLFSIVILGSSARDEDMVKLLAKIK